MTDDFKKQTIPYDPSLLAVMRDLAKEVRELKQAFLTVRTPHATDLLNTKEVAEYCRCSRREVTRWTNPDLYPEPLDYFNMGREWKFRRADVDLFVERKKILNRSDIRFSKPRKKGVAA